MRPWIAMSVVLSLALACTFDSTGLDSTTAVAGPATNPVGSDVSTISGTEAGSTQPEPTGEASSESASGSGTASASEATTQGSTCGNGAIDAGEDCDGAELGGVSCQSLGHTEGELLCSELCKFNEAQCSSPGCGDGIIDEGEACDCGEGECTAPQLNNTSCSSLPAPMGGNFNGGTLGCASPGPCTYDTSGCTYCGDGAKNGGEGCDGADLGGLGCMDSGFVAGTLACSSSCALDTSGCTNCGNQMIDANEMCDGSNLNGNTCATIDADKYAGGALKCNDGCGGFDAGDCNSGNCCQTSNTGGTCAVTKIRDCVCLWKPSCCNNIWDFTCVVRASLCGAKC